MPSEEPPQQVPPLGCAILCGMAIVGLPALAAILGVCARVFRWAAWGEAVFRVALYQHGEVSHH
jgi:hypothetical protein